jgi:hypothetical protein
MKKRMTTIFGAALCALAALSTLSAGAHQLWLEDDAGGAKLYFGEFGDNLHEISPGYLDKLAQPVATLINAAGEKSVPLANAKDGYSSSSKLVNGDALIAVDALYPVIESKDGDKPVRTVWTPAARFVTTLSARPPKLTLDVVPTGKVGEFQVFFRNAPLKEVDVTLTAASGWSRQGSTDVDGKVRFSLPWKGRYGLLVRHREDKPGSRPGAGGAQAYDRASFATTLTFVSSSGLEPPPPPPPAAPNIPGK